MRNFADCTTLPGPALPSESFTRKAQTRWERRAGPLRVARAHVPSTAPEGSNGCADDNAGGDQNVGARGEEGGQFLFSEADLEQPAAVPGLPVYGDDGPFPTGAVDVLTHFRLSIAYPLPTRPVFLAHVEVACAQSLPAVALRHGLPPTAWA